MAGGTVLTSAQTATVLQDTVANPVQTQNRSIVHLTLVFDGVSFDPAALLAALDAAYGTVAAERNYPGRGTYVINVSA